MGVASAIIGSAVIGGIGASQSARAQRSAARRATEAQEAGAAASLEEQRRQFDAVQQLFQPYVQAGTGTLAQQLNLIGAGGAEAQQQAISALQAGPEYQALVQSGEEAILSQAAATGGLRGGNVQRALSQYRPQVLSSLINQQYQRLGGITSIGQASAARQASQGSAISGGIAQTQADLGAAIAQGQLAQGQATANMFGNIAGGIGQAAGMYAAYNTFGGSQPTTNANPSGITAQGLSSALDIGRTAQNPIGTVQSPITSRTPIQQLSIFPSG